MTPTKWWRAEGGYQDVPADRDHTAPPPPAPAPAPAAPAQMCLCHSANPGYGYVYPFPYGQHYAPWMLPQASFVRGPIGIAGLGSPPPPYVPFGNAALAPAQAPEKAQGQVCGPPLTCAPPGPEKKEDKKDDKKKDGDDKKTKKENPWAPPKLPDGANYMFDGEHTTVHIFKKAAPIWTEKYRGQELAFKIFKVSVNFSVKMVIEQTLKKGGDDCKGWAATEAVESGDGVWQKGTTVEYDSDKAKGTLKSMGWTAKRGDVLPPVWIVVHKVDFK